MGSRRVVPSRGKKLVVDDANPPSAAGFVEPVGRSPLAVFLLLLVLYVATLAPSVVGGDSGELTAAALTGGVPHPPGYPIFALLARLFAVFPLGHSPAWRVNLLSAVSTAAAAGFVCASVQVWTRNAWAGFLAAVLLGTNTLVWSHATATEVFGLNAMFVALAFYLWSRVEHTLARCDVYALSLASGLAMCNHHTFLFVGAPLVLRSFWVARCSLGARGMTSALGLGVLGLAPYLYLPFASASAAAVSWGHETTFEGFLEHILRLSYGTFRLGQASSGGAFVAEGTFFPTLWLMWGKAFPRFLWVGPILALAGFYLGWKSRQMRKAVSALLILLGLYSLTFCALSNLSTSRPLYLTVLGRFCIEFDVLLAIAAGLGFAALLQRLHSPWMRRGLMLGPAGAVFALGVVVHAGEVNKRNNTVFRDFVATAFASIPPNAIVITMGDHLTGSVFYFHEVEKLRPDVIHLDRELLGFSWYSARKRRLSRDLYLPEGGYGRYGWNIRQLADGNPSRPLVVIDRLDAWDQSWKEGYKIASNGLVHPIVRVSEFPTFEAWAKRDRKAIGTYDVAPALGAPEGSWENALGQLVLATQAGRAHLALVFSSENGNAPPPARLALHLLEDVVAKAGGDEKLAIAAWPGMRKLYLGPGVWKDLGIGYEILSRVDRSYAPRIALAFENFVGRAEADDPDLPAARNYLERERATQVRGRP